MALICEECGKIYHIDKEKLKKQLKGDFAKTKCRICGHIIQISKEDLEKDDDVSLKTDDDAFFNEFSDEEQSFGYESEFEGSKAEDPDPVEEKNDIEEKRHSLSEGEGRKGFGLRTKMFFLFLVIPILLMSASGIFSQIQLKRLSENITEKGTAVVKDFAEQRIAEKARDVALQCQIYLQSHPELRKSDFNYENEFKKIAVQKIGKTGYTSLAERNLPTEPLDNFRIWAHPNPSIIGIPLFKKLQKELGAEFDLIVETLKPVIRGEEVAGYYKWKEVSGELKEKFLVAVHVKHTRYIIIATAPIDEFTKPIRDLENEAAILTTQTRDVNIFILAATLVIISIAILVYGYRITKNIKYLTETADRISVGDLDVKIEVQAKDEIGSLADAISRMQDSLRLSIERLRRKK
ncbi:MAG: HAMP domain-containing protein [Desulfobacteraceae bacterium]|nr:HAMP domain-containing protein [Desulfobacteraceae bacterium]